LAAVESVSSCFHSGEDIVKRSGSSAGKTKKAAASSLQAELARQIMEIARDEAWPPGQHVPELALAKRFGVSRSPVRAALEMLAQRDVLRLRPGEGYLVARDLESVADDLAPLSDGENLYTAIMSDRAVGRLERQVSESELSTRYRATRGAVRKVLMRLATEGLTERLRGHGWRFAETLDTDTAIAESYRFRIAVECASLRQPGYAIDAAQMARLRRAHERILALPSGSVNGRDWFKVNSSFHEALAAWSGNRFILQAIRQQNKLRQLNEYADFPTLGQTRIGQSCREHLGILDALEAKDLAFAESLLQRHLRLAGQLE
jgi:DNA-binding GntR family transcriptional regulator